jgi:hypothetical protein
MKTPGVKHIDAPPATFAQDPSSEGFQRVFLALSGASFCILTKKRRQSPAVLGAQLRSDALLAAQLTPATAGAIFLHLERPRAGKSAGELKQLFEAPAAALARCTRQRTS